MVAPAADLLATILAATRRGVAVRRSRESLAAMTARAEARARTRPRGFRAALDRAGRVNVIAECKRRSPSRGVLRAAYDPVALAVSYERAGAAAVSVLTEPAFFDGALDHLRAVADRVAVPVLRKDFVVDEYQIAEARANGADAVLLIVAALDDGELRRLHAAARTLELDVLVEVHDSRELERAIQAGAELIGVNNRNLRTLEIDTGVSRGLVAMMPPGVTAVSESGFQSPAELAGMRDAGYHAFLVGERLMTSVDPGETLREWLTDGKGSA